ncbi:MAG: class I SAM-dependent methyltransferase [Myxococcales bacterium]|nr:class I SAM-dependent methyltransferase [Myxococcales bacterium]
MSASQSLDTYSYNRSAWNREVDAGKNQWTQPVSPERIERARRGDWQVVLTPSKPVPHAWFGAKNGRLDGLRLLGLASGGGQQGPIFAAAGADVTIFDASDRQLDQDRQVAERDGLSIRTLQGNMKDLSALADDSFDVVFNPCSLGFVDEVRPVFREVARVLRPGGAFLCGFVNPWFYLFDSDAFDAGKLVVSRRLPYRDQDYPDMMAKFYDKGEPIEFSHTLDDLLGGQLQAGLLLSDLFEDSWSDWRALSGIAEPFLATRAIKK